jgi:SAM-dependent methyltransferase
VLALEIPENRVPVAYGFLDSVSYTMARGWAVAEDGSAPLLVLIVDGKTAQIFRPNRPRPDLHNSYPGNLLGFEIPIAVQPDTEVAVLDALGNHLTGSPARPQPSREDKVTTKINKAMRVLEIGAGYNPLVPKAGGWNSFSLDHATREELIAKYQGHGIDTRLIEDVDFLWKDGPLESAIPSEQIGSFDACVASHLIEHIPDPIGFYNSLGYIIGQNGVISLAVPDKRFTFDFFRPFSTTSQMIQAHREVRTRHSKISAFDNCALLCRVGTNIVWSAGTDASPIEFMSHKLSDALSAYENHDQNDGSPYVDMHGWIYTPSSFELAILELNNLGFIDWTIDVSYPTVGCEFFVTLKRSQQRLSDDEVQQMRLDLNKRIVLELGEQATLLTKSL